MEIWGAVIGYEGVVASDFGMSPTATQSIKHRRTWKHLN